MTGLIPIFKDTGQSRGFFEAFESITGLKVLPFSCGRAAIVAGLRALGLGRMDEILVPPFLCYAVLSALERTVFPTMTPSNRTKAILVYHQFGYPQDMASIKLIAQKKGWIILNNCANTIFTKVDGRFLLDWGDFTVISLSKLYPCGLGGGFISRRPEIFERVSNRQQGFSEEHSSKAEEALDTLIKINQGAFGCETVFKVNGLYGYLPDLVSFPKGAMCSLPATVKEIEKDILHRKRIWSLVKEMLPEHVPPGVKEEIVPFAVPITGEPRALEKTSRQVKEELFFDAPILHYDFARNMLKPDYKKAIVIGCHAQWSEDLVVRICDLLLKNI